MNVPDVSATDAARNFADILDAVEHRGEHFTVLRRDRTVANIEPISTGGGASVKALLRCHAPERRWRQDLDAVRRLLELDERW